MRIDGELHNATGRTKIDELGQLVVQVFPDDDEKPGFELVFPRDEVLRLVATVLRRSAALS